MVEGNTEGNEYSKSSIKILDEDETPPIGFQYMICHMVFSIRMEDFSRKAHLVVGGLNELKVKTSDIQNAYLTALCSEKVHTTLGTEFGENKGKTAVIVTAFYMI